jgi:hypothetical protein
MNFLKDILDLLAGQLPCGYHVGGPPSTEPTALAVMALVAQGRHAAAAKGIEWLAGLQAPDGSVGPTASQSVPGWPTSLAVLAAHFATNTDSAKRATTARRFDIDRAVAWILRTRGEALPRTPEMGHDTTLVGWPWVEDTHSWIEPTAMHVLALTSVGRGDHPRTREAVRLLIDRLLPDGGCNYGNTVVMNQVLRPHLQPTGLAMLALASESDQKGKVAKSLDYLARELSPRTASASLAYGLMGMAAQNRFPTNSLSWLEAAYRRTIASEPAPYRLALIALAAMAADSPLNLKSRERNRAAVAV